MLELIDCIDDDLEETTEKEDNYFLLLLGALLGLYSKRLDTEVDFNAYKTKWMTDGIWYKDDLTNYKTTLLFYIRNDLKQALARGDKLPEILTQVRKRFRNSVTGLESLISTRCTDYESDILRDWIVATGHSKYVWITIQDGKQCDDCDAMDGLIFHIKDYERGVTAPTLHRRCRCQIAPFIEPATL
jgi:SPP1 gp7 family putative phage head morphogenesis protein